MVGGTKLDPAARRLKRAELKRERKLSAKRKERQQQVARIGREAKMTAGNIKLHQNAWRKIINDVALPSMKSDVIYAWHSSEIVMDLKDMAISLLKDEIENEQHRNVLNFKTHAEHVDSFINEMNQNLRNTKQWYDNRVQELLTDFHNESENWAQAAGEQDTNLKLIMELIRQKLVKGTIKGRGILLSKVDMETNLGESDFQLMVAIMHESILDLYTAVKASMKDYGLKMKDARKKIKDKLDQDEANQDLIRQQAFKRAALYKTAHELSEKYVAIKRVKGQQIDALVEEEKRLHDALTTFKNRLLSHSKSDEDKMRHLVRQSKSAIEYLINLREKGKRILTLMSICRKFETLPEKILKYVHAPKQTKSGSTSVLNLLPDEMEDDLSKFWIHIAHIDTKKYELSEERKLLLRDNEKLKVQIHQFCECFVCPPNVIKQTLRTPRKKFNVKNFPVTDVTQLLKNRKKISEKIKRRYT